MAIDLNNFAVVKFGNPDIERNYINDILHALAAKLSQLEELIDAGGGTTPPADTGASYVTVEPEVGLANGRSIQGESGVVSTTDYGPGSFVEVGVEEGGIGASKLNVSGTASSTTYIKANGTTLEYSTPPADLNYIHTQTVPSATWVVVHNLGKYPSVSVVDSAGSNVEGYVTYDSDDQVTLTFIGAFSGVAYLN